MGKYKYKMLCLDLDGTLLNSEHKISRENKKSIQALSEDIQVVLVSARPPAGIICFLDELNISAPVICYNGALIFDEHGRQIYDMTIAPNVIRDIYQKYSCEVSINIYIKNDWYVEKKDKWVRQEEKIIGLKPRIVNLKKLLYDTANTDKIATVEKGANKILLMGIKQTITGVEKFLRRKHGKRLEIYMSKAEYLEIVAEGVSKTGAIKILQKKYNITEREIAAIGDNYNDLDMLNYAGLGVAVDNAPEKVKKEADRVTLSNDDNGVTKAIKNLII
ncbi:MAG: Cof-type HAD-IIB family hydrolase [Halanaerobiaceae bacterium]